MSSHVGSAAVPPPRSVKEFYTHLRVRDMDIHTRTVPFSFPPGVVPNYDNPPSISYKIVIISLVFGILAFTFVSLRIFTKIRISKQLGWDDFFSVAAMLAAIARTVISIVLANRFGVGRHLWDVRPTLYTTIRNLQWIQDMIYLLGIMAAKLAVLSLLIRLFRPNRRFTQLCYLMAGAVIVYCVVFIFLYAFNCTPEYYSWHVPTGPTPNSYKCIEIIYIIMAIGGFNLGTDLILFIMPLPLIWKLKLNQRQRWGLTVVFATALFVVITTIVRLVIVCTTLSESDQTYIVVPEIIWLTIELDVGIICGCLPVLAPIYTRLVDLQFLPNSLRGFISRSFGSSKSSLRRTTQKDSTSLRRDSLDDRSEHTAFELYAPRAVTHKTEVTGPLDNDRSIPPVPQGHILLKHTVDVEHLTLSDQEREAKAEKV